MDTSEGAPGAGGLKGALARLAESVVGLFRTRAELAGVELVEERERLVLRLALLVAGIVVLAFAALFVGVFIIALFWDSHPLVRSRSSRSPMRSPAVYDREVKDDRT